MSLSTEFVRGMASSEFVDPYLIPGSHVLRNLVGATTNDALSTAEADLSFARALQLIQSPVPSTNDLTELSRIHRHLFQDVYDWAGEIRTVDVRKDVPGAEFFLPHGYIEGAAAICFTELADENHRAARAGSDDLDLRPLIEMFDKVVTRPQDVGTEVWQTAEIERLSINPAQNE